MQHLKIGTFLQDGKYRIEKVLGQGGFGITYLAIQQLSGTKVCIKEFFVKEYCGRDECTSHVLLGTQGNHEMVSRFMAKFLKEASIISKFEHRNIIRVHDVFKENNTAYYVMDYVDGESLSDMIARRGAIPEYEAISYIIRVADALSYIHERNINHLDVKPSNIMIRKGDWSVILIDFGLSKQYDEQGSQTSTTPVGISHGYAPMEQYNPGGVGIFSAQTDIYSLGATLYKLVTGNTPPQASDVLNDGLPELPAALSAKVKNAINQAMRVRKKDRPKDVKAFIDLISISTDSVYDEVPKIKQHQAKPVEEEATIIMNNAEIKDKYYQFKTIDNSAQPSVTIVSGLDSDQENKKRIRYWIVALVFATMLGIYGYTSYFNNHLSAEYYHNVQEEHQVYLSYILDGNNLFANKNYSESIKRYEQAQSYERKYFNTEFSTLFNEKADQKISEALDANYKYKVEQANLNQARMEREAAIKAEKARKEAQYNRTHGKINGHEYVDLGLSVKWATCNIGASSPEQYGNYYEWSETNTESDGPAYYSEIFHKTMNIDIGGDYRYDAASVNWGSSWRLPSKDEFDELIQKCTWYWTTIRDKVGCEVVGPNGNSIFLPAAGYRLVSHFDNKSGYYWSSTPTSNEFGISPYILAFGQDKITIHYRGRTQGLSIRPVSK